MAAIVHSQMLKLYAGPRSISGSFGASPSQAVVTAYLSQPSCVLSANAEGVVEDYAPASTTIVVEVSGRTDTGNWTLSTAKSPSVGTVSVVGATISVSGMTDDAGWVDITASKAGYESVTRHFTLAKVRQKGGVRVATTLPANPSEVGGELAIFLDVADPALRGMYGWSGTAWVKTGELLNGSVTADKLAADAIQATKFADGIEPVSIVSLLPNVVGYTGPKLVFLTTDNKIYRYTGSSWVKELPAEDLTGQLVADQLASNSVTTGKIQAGAVTTDQLAAKAVTASKLVLTDTSNIYPDYDILDSSFYSGAAFTRVGGTSLNLGAYALRIAANAAESRVESQWFQVEPSADYFVEVSASQSISGATGAAAAYIEYGSFTGGTSTPTVTRSELIVRRVSTTSTARADIAVTTTSNERRARLVFVREAGGTGVADFGGPVIRRRNNAKLIVDGSVVATKIAADAVQTHHLLAGAVTADKLTVNKLSAITADMGDVTAGTFTLSSTGYIRGGATNFATGAGFWMGYDAGTYKLRAGIPGNSGFSWDGSAFNVYGPDGSVTISSGVVDWGKISGSGKPEDGATKNRIFTQATAPVGASNGDIWIDTSVTPSVQKMMVGGSWQLAATVGATLAEFVVNSTLLNEQFTTGFASNWTNRSGGGNASQGAGQGSTDGSYVYFGDNSGNDQVWYVRTGALIAYDPAKLYRMRVRARTTAGAGVCYIGLEGVAANGTTIVDPDGASNGIGHYFVVSGALLDKDWTEYAGFVQGKAATGDASARPSFSAPGKMNNNVAFVRPVIISNYPAQPGYTDVDYCILEEGYVSNGNIDGKINAANVTTFIDNAALGNAQIGGDLWSTNHVSGASGWRIYRDGNAEFRNVIARGDIEASTLKANVAMVGTLNIAGNAVIVPVLAEYPGELLSAPYMQGVWHEEEVLGASVFVNVDCNAILTIGTNSNLIGDWHAISAGKGTLGHANWPTGTLWAAISIYRNGAWVKDIADWRVGWGGKGVGSHMDQTSGIVRDAVFINHYSTMIQLVSGANNISVRGRVLMADGHACIRRNYNTYLLIQGAQR